MRLWCKIIDNQQKVAECTVEIIIKKRFEILNNDCMLANALSEAAKLLDIERPLITAKHTKEISEFGITSFLPSDFMDSVNFEKLSIELIP